MPQPPGPPGYSAAGEDEWTSLHRRMARMTPEERDAYRMEHYARLREVAKAAGIELPENPPWRLSPEERAKQRAEEMDAEWEAFRGSMPAEPPLHWRPMPSAPWSGQYEGGETYPMGDRWSYPMEDPWSYPGGPGVQDVGPAPYPDYGPTPYGDYGPAPYGDYGRAPYGDYGPAPHGEYGPAPYGDYGPWDYPDYGTDPWGRYPR